MELTQLFPDVIDQSQEKNYYQKVRELKEAELEEIAFGTDITKRVESIEAYFAEMIKPASFDGAGSIERGYELQFEETCHFLSKHTNKDPKKLSVKEFYSLLKYIENKGSSDA